VFSRPAPQHKVTEEKASAEAIRASRLIHRALRRGDMKNAARHIAGESFGSRRVNLLQISEEIREIMKQPSKQR
jgi:carboxypeptidase C (cathepsin A)